MKFKYSTEIQTIAFGILKPRELTPGVTYIVRRWSSNSEPDKLMYCSPMHVLLDHDGTYYAWMDYDRPKKALREDASKPEDKLYHQLVDARELAKE